MSAITLLLQDDCWQVKAHAIKGIVYTCTCIVALNVHTYFSVFVYMQIHNYFKIQPQVHVEALHVHSPQIIIVIILAVGTLKITSKAVVSHLLWAARFEQLPAVRAQVCNTLAVVGGVKDQRVVPALKELLNVEDDELVLK